MTADRLALLEAIRAVVALAPLPDYPKFQRQLPVVLDADAGEVYANGAEVDAATHLELRGAGKLALPRRLAGVLLAMRGERVTLDVVDHKLRVGGDDGVRFVVECRQVHDVAPCAPGGELARLDAEQVAGPLAGVLHAMSEDESRPTLRAVYLEGEQIIATDGHRIAFRPLPNNGLPRRLLIERGAAQSLARLAGADSPGGLGPIVLRSGARGDSPVLVMERGKCRVSFAPSSWDFPDYSQVLPDGDAGLELQISREAMLDALRALLTVRDLAKHNRYLGARMTADGTALRLEADRHCRFTFVAAIRLAEPATFGDAVCVNAQYLFDALQASADQGDELSLRISEPLLPVQMRCGNHREVVMPMRDVD